MSKQNNLKDYLTDLYEGIASKKPGASRNPQNFRSEIEGIKSDTKLTTATFIGNDTFKASDYGADGFSQVTVNVKPKLQDKTATANGTVKADSGYDGLSKVEVNVAGEVLPKYDGEVIIEGEPESGGGDGGSAEFNIAYGDTAPTDTSKLWVKANEPEAVSVTFSIVTAGEELETALQALTTKASNIASAVVGTKVYLFGGAWGSSNNQNKIEVFDTENNSVEKLNVTLPTAASGIASAVIGAKVYLFGGMSGINVYLDTINVFDTENNSIETLNVKLPKATNDIASAVVGAKVYLFGGTNYYAINEFNSVTGTISTLMTNTPIRPNTTAAVIGTKVYLFGGGSWVDTIHMYDTENNTIETLNVTLPVAAEGIASAVIGKKIYLFGGKNSASNFLQTINVFDAENNTISTLNVILPLTAYDIASAVVGTKVYLFGGRNGSGHQDTIRMFLALMPLATNNMLIEASVTKNRFNLLPNVELGVNNVYLGNAEGNGEKVEAYLHNGTEWVEV